MRSIKNKAKAADLFALMMQAPRTRQELLDLTGMDAKILRGWIDALHDAGCIRIKEWSRNPRGGSPYPIYEFQVKPFNKPDEVGAAPAGYVPNPKNLIKPGEAHLWSRLLTGNRTPHSVPQKKKVTSDDKR